MSKPLNVLIFGECMLELMQSAENQFASSFGGDTYNTAVYLKRLSPKLDVQYLTAIGEDQFSTELLMRLGEQAINTAHVYRCPKRNLGLYVITNDQSGERFFQYWRTQSAATQTIRLLDRSIHAPDVLYFSGISLAILTQSDRDTFFDKVQQWKEQGTRVAFDPNYRARLWPDSQVARANFDRAYELADIAFPGKDDHADLYGHQTSQAITEHLSPFSISEIIIKNGADGVFVLHDEKQFIIPVNHLKHVVDATAAGDSFVAGYLASRLSDNDVIQAVNTASRVAAQVIVHKGAIIPEEAFTIRV